MTTKRKFYPPPPQSMYFPEIPGIGGPFKHAPQYSGILSNESPNHNNLRTNSVKGQFSKPPKIGEMFCMVGESLDPSASMRHVNTSPVVSMDYELIGVVVFKTESGSTYRLDYHRIEEGQDG